MHIYNTLVVCIDSTVKCLNKLHVTNFIE